MVKAFVKQNGEVIPELKRVGPKIPPLKPDFKNDPRYMRRPLRDNEKYVPPKNSTLNDNRRQYTTKILNI